MRVGIDARMLGEGARGGGATYTRELVRALLELGSGDEYVLLAGFRQAAPRFEQLFAASHRAALRVRSLSLPGRLVDRLWRQGAVPPVELFTGPVDAFHSTDFVCVPQWRGRSIVTIHDIVWRLHPEFTSDAASPFFRAAERSAREAHCVVTDSEASRREIIHYLGVPEERVQVVPLAAGGEFRPVAEPDETLTRHGIDRPFLLSVGTIQPRKNYTTLIDVYNRLRAGGEFDGLLVIVGGWGWKYEAVREASTVSPYRDDIRILTGVPTVDLPALYSAAKLFVFLSLYEGFGIPLVEAMACGCPVVSSNLSCMPEVVGDAAVLVDPRAPEAVAAELGALLRDGDRQQRLRALSLSRAETFSWQNSARRLRALYRECC